MSNRFTNPRWDSNGNLYFVDDYGNREGSGSAERQQTPAMTVHNTGPHYHQHVHYHNHGSSGSNNNSSYAGLQPRLSPSSNNNNGNNNGSSSNNASVTMTRQFVGNVHLGNGLFAPAYLNQPTVHVPVNPGVYRSPDGRVMALGFPNVIASVPSDGFNPVGISVFQPSIRRNW